SGMAINGNKASIKQTVKRATRGKAPHKRLSHIGSAETHFFQNGGGGRSDLVIQISLCGGRRPYPPVAGRHWRVRRINPIRRSQLYGRFEQALQVVGEVHECRSAVGLSWVVSKGTPVVHLG